MLSPNCGGSGSRDRGAGVSAMSFPHSQHLPHSDDVGFLMGGSLGEKGTRESSKNYLLHPSAEMEQFGYVGGVCDH